MSFDIATQKALIDTLKNHSPLMDLVSGVYDFVPQDAVFPYVSLGEDDLNELDTSSNNGAKIIVTFHTWSVARGKLETKTIQGQIRKALHEAELVAHGYEFHFCYWESSQSFIDADGVTRHGVCTYHIYIHEE